MISDILKKEHRKIMQEHAKDKEAGLPFYKNIPPPPPIEKMTHSETAFTEMLAEKDMEIQSLKNDLDLTIMCVEKCIELMKARDSESPLATACQNTLGRLNYKP